MGILDDAIREHLELKRRLGADESERKQLEDEAFGPPARPGDPDFATGEEPAVAVEEPPSAETPVVQADAEAPSAEMQAAEAPPAEPETTLMDGPEELAVPAEPEPEPEPQPELDAAVEPPPEPEASAAPAAPVEPADPDPDVASEPPMEAPELEAEAVEEAPAAEAEESSFTTAEREAIADQPTVIYDRATAEELEMGELDLDIEDEVEEVTDLPDEPLTGEEDVEAFTADEEALAEPPSDEVEVVESEAEVIEEDAEELEPDAEAEGEDEDLEEPATGDEDVLEETPEFLRDNPDDDELWFEQGEPKDFDF